MVKICDLLALLVSVGGVVGPGPLPGGQEELRTEREEREDSPRPSRVGASSDPEWRWSFPSLCIEEIPYCLVVNLAGFVIQRRYFPANFLHGEVGNTGTVLGH